MLKARCNRQRQFVHWPKLPAPFSSGILQDDENTEDFGIFGRTVEIRKAILEYRAQLRHFIALTRAWESPIRYEGAYSQTSSDPATFPWWWRTTGCVQRWWGRFRCVHSTGREFFILDSKSLFLDSMENDAVGTGYAGSGLLSHWFLDDVPGYTEFFQDFSSLFLFCLKVIYNFHTR